MLEPGDCVVGTYREHGHALARCVPRPRPWRRCSASRTAARGAGRLDAPVRRTPNFLGGTAIVGGGLPLAVGVGSPTIAARPVCHLCFFGDGAVDEGEFHEAINLAALWWLPVLFVCENNRYGMGTALERSELVTVIRDKAACYNLEAEVVDGMDVVAVEAAARRAIASIRERPRPIFLECHTYRFRAHSMFDAQLYRDKAEVEAWRAKGPIVRFQGWLPGERADPPRTTCGASRPR